MIDRRNFLRASTMTTGGLMLAPWLHKALGTDSPQSPPKRFIFMHKGNGLFPSALVPPSLSNEDAEKEQRKQSFTVDLNRHDLPEWMNALSAHKSNLTILQGLSGKMCTTGHHTWQSSLGAYKANERLSSIRWATVDFELARLFPSPLGHIELACFPNGGGNSRGDINGIDKGFSARGPQQPNIAFGSPRVAMQELFKSVSADRTDRVQYDLERMVLEFTANGQADLARHVAGNERTKIANYADSVEAIREQNRRIEAIADSIRRHLPRLDRKYFADDISTVDRQLGHTEILLSTLISGMTNVVTFTADELGTPYTGLPGIEQERVNLHDVGHGKSVGAFSAAEVRTKVRTQHMRLIDTIVTRLKGVPEGDGNMFDNTVLFYFPDNGETHHSNGVEWPFIVLAGRHTRLDISGKYIRLPGYGQEGHKTLGNWYTTLLNAYGNPIRHYGDLDPGLENMRRGQTGPIQQFRG